MKALAREIVTSTAPVNTTYVTVGSSKKKQLALPGKGREGFTEEVTVELTPKDGVFKDGVCQTEGCGRGRKGIPGLQRIV